MTKAKKSKKSKAKDDFESVSKRLECDEDKAAFEKKLGKIANVGVNPFKPRPRTS